MTTWAMIDLETLDTIPGGQVLTIGGVKFDPTTWRTHSDFYYRFNINEQEERGMSVNEGTLEWWGRQADHIILEAFGDEDRTDVGVILRALKKWFVGVDEVWAQGFMDTTMIEAMCREFGEPVPWAFWQCQDLRTLIRRMPEDPRKKIKFDAHNALEDCKGQVKALKEVFHHFGMVK